MSGKKLSSFARCVEVTMRRSSVLRAFRFNLLLLIQRETSWRQSLSWLRERQVPGVVKDIDVCAIYIKVMIQVVTLDNRS